jgi:hypothetical protein
MTETPTIYTCPYTNIEYSGHCPQYKCIAHMGNTKKHESSCVWKLFNNRDRLSVHEIAYALDKKPDEVKKDYEAGLETIKKMMALNEVLQSLRSKSTDCCTKCGHSGGDCDNKVKCLKRETRVNKVLSHPPFNNPYLKIDKYMIWQLRNWIKHNEEKRKHFLDDFPVLRALGKI